MTQRLCSCVLGVMQVEYIFTFESNVLCVVQRTTAQTELKQAADNKISHNTAVDVNVFVTMFPESAAL